MRTRGGNRGWAPALLAGAILILGSSGELGAQREEPAELAELRAKFEEAKEERLLGLKRGYGQELQRVLEELTKAGKLEEALVVKEELDALTAELNAGGGPAVLKGNEVDILALADPAKHGRPIESWSKKGRTLDCVEGGGRAKMILPYVPPAEYDYSVTFTQPEAGDGVALILPNGARGVFDVVAAENGGTMVGLSVGGVYPEESKREKAGWFEPGETYTLVVKVRTEGVLVMVNGEEAFRYAGDRRRLQSSRDQAHQWWDRIAVSAGDRAEISKLVVTEVLGRGRVLH